jgi:hypothetical protein
VRVRLALAAALLLACEVAAPPPSATGGAPTGAATTTAAPSPSGAISADMTAALLANPLPFADAFALARSVRGRDGQPGRAYEPVRTTPPSEGIGSREQFWVYDWEKKRNFRMGATVRAITADAKWWIADDVTFDGADLDRAAKTFQDRILPGTRKVYGAEWSPGIDADPRVNVLVVRFPGRVAGYYSSTDEQPRWVYEFSAEREIVFINMPPNGRLATESLYGTLAHELCHMIQFNKRARSIVWFSEGQAELCSRVTAGQSSGAGFETLYLQQPDTQLNDWPEVGDLSLRHYGGSFLFLEFLRQHAGGEALINAFLDEGIDTPDDLDEVLRERGQPGLEELFADFVAANALVRETPDARYRYQPGLARITTAAGAATEDRVALGATVRSSAKQYGARYVELPRASQTVRFAPETTAARVIPTDPHSGRAFWWSDRADALDSTMTRTVDLRSARSATLRFWTWHEIEADFDYAYVEVSSDGGARWATLPATSTTTSDPNGVSLGHGLTGLSGGGSEPAWVQQTVDLSAFAGRSVLLRFQYVTDGALNLNGIAIDDLEIPEIGWRDDAEGDGDWTANGFIRSSNLVAQRFIVQVIRFGAQPTVERRIVAGTALELAVDATADRRAPLLVVTGLAPRTTQPAAFTVTAEARR